jgi:hypothetical protein
MKSLLTFLALAAFVLASCTSTRFVTDPRDREDINDRAREEPARVHVRNTTPQHPTGPFVANDLRLGQDSIVWFDARTRTMVSLPTQTVAAIEFTSNAQGIRRGLGLGMLGGGLAGVLIGYYVQTGYVSVVNSLLGCVGGVVVGGATGMLAGAIAGSHDRYELPETPQR